MLVLICVSVASDYQVLAQLNIFIFPIFLGQLYNRAAPTKQNLLCDEQSAIEVVLNHKDFQTTWESVYAEQQKPHLEQQQGSSSSQNQNILDNLNLDLVSQFSNLTSFTTTTTTTTSNN